MSSLGLIVALPEMVLLAAASIVLVVDLFVSDERRNVTYGLTMLTLLLVGAAVCIALARNEVVVGFGGMYIADPMGHVLKLFAIFCSGFMLICAQSYARARGIFESLGVYLGYGLLLYTQFYDIKHVLLLGRVTSGEGGNLLLEKARQVLRTEAPELADRIRIHLPDEATRRVGQSIAAASLPRI